MQNIKTRKEYKELKALNYSGSKELLKSPAHYKASLDRHGDDSKALRMGSLTHAIVLQPEIVEATYAVSPECDRRTKEGKALYEAFMATAGGKTAVSVDEWNTCNSVSNSMIEAIHANKVMFSDTELMLTVGYNGIQLKCAIDAVGDDGYLYDLKTTEDASWRGFRSSILSYRYHLQAHFYQTVYHLATGVKPKGFRFVAAEKSEPFAHAVYECGEILAAQGRQDFETAVTLYSSCLMLDEWPSYGSEPKVIDIN